MAILSHAMQEQVWTFLGKYTPEANLFFLALPLELLSPVPLPARGLGRMPVHHGISMQRKLPSRRSKWLAAQPAVSTEPDSIPKTGKRHGSLYDIQRVNIMCSVGSTSAMWTERDAPKAGQRS